MASQKVSMKKIDSGITKSMNKAKTVSEQDGAAFLRQSFAMEQEVLRVKLKLASESVSHSGELGNVTENHFIEFLKRYLPKRYSVDSGIVIDSNGKTSDQIDIIIFDNQYTPVLLAQHNHRYVPAEAVYAVLEVKPSIDKQYLEYAGEKAESVRVLTRTSGRVISAGDNEITTTPKEILAGIVSAEIGWKKGFASSAFASNLESLQDLQNIDFGLAMAGEYFDNFKESLHRKEGSNALAVFLFRLLGKLQSLGTAAAADYTVYETAFEE